MITLIQYAGQNVSPENDASVYNALARGANSCLTPIEANINEAGNIAFTDGYMIIQGRVVHLESHTITPALPTSGTATGTIYIEIDITNADAPCQIKTTVGAFTPIKQDINLGGTMYQHKIGTYSATQSGLVLGSVVTSLPNSADATFELGFKDETNGRIRMSANATGADLTIYDKGTSGKIRATMQTTIDSAVETLRNSNGESKFVASGGASGGQIYCKHANNLGASANAVELGAMGSTSDSRGYVKVSDKSGTTTAIIDGEFGNEFEKPTKFHEDTTFNGKLIAKVVQSKDTTGIEYKAGEATGNLLIGATIARITYDGDGGRLIIYNRNGDERVRLGIKGSGAGKIEIIDENGNTHNVLTD